MRITTPDVLISDQIVWQGELQPPADVVFRGPSINDLPVVQIAEPTFWPAAAIKAELGKDWSPPADARDYALARLTFNLNPPPEQGFHYAEATLSVRLLPRVGQAAVIAHDVHPLVRSITQSRKYTLGLKPNLKFDVVEVGGFEAGVEIEHRNAFAVIQAYGMGTGRVQWRFSHHRECPLIGCQSVYVVIASPQAAEGVRLQVNLEATLESRFGPIKLAAVDVRDKTIGEYHA